MPDSDDITWIKGTANELNNLLQVIVEASRFLQRHSGDRPETQHYFDMIRSATDRAAQLSKSMLDHADRHEGAAERKFQPPSAPAPALVPQAAPRPVVHPFPKPGQFPPGITPLQPAAGQVSPAIAEGPKADEIKIANPEGSRELILIVDDENFVTLLAQRVLTDEGYRVITAKDGFRALEIYKKLQEQINLVILDFTMPIMDGSEVFTELRKLNPKVPVVLSSGFTEQDQLKWMLARGLRGFIPKPYTQQKLLLQVRSTLDAIKNERKS